MNHQELLKKLKIDISKPAEEHAKIIAGIEKITTDMLQGAIKYGERKAFQSPSVSQQDDTVFRKGSGNWEEAIQDKLLRPKITGMPGRMNNANVARGFPTAEGGDSPSVAILRSALSRYTSYKQTTNSLLCLVYEQIMMAILFNDDGMTSSLEADLDQIINDDKEDRIEYMYDDIRDHLALEIEKVIWLALYFPSMSMAMGRYITGQVEDAGVIKGVDADDRFLLQNYWWARFPDPQSDAGLPFPNKYLLFIHFQEVYQLLQEYGIQNAIRVEP